MITPSVDGLGDRLPPRLQAVLVYVDGAIEDRISLGDALAWLRTLQRSQAAILDEVEARDVVEDAAAVLGGWEEGRLNMVACREALLALRSRLLTGRTYLLRLFVPRGSGVGRALVEDLARMRFCVEGVTVKVFPGAPEWARLSRLPHAELVRDGLVVNRMVSPSNVPDLASFVRARIRPPRVPVAPVW